MPKLTRVLFAQDYKKSMVKIGIDLGQVGFRDKTWIATKKPITFIQDCCEELAQLADILIRDVDDPLILQPATLDIATVKRKPNDDTMDFGIGFDSRPLNGTHVIRDVRFQSPAHQCARIHPGDEVVQINYQTVVSTPTRQAKFWVTSIGQTRPRNKPDI